MKLIYLFLLLLLVSCSENSSKDVMIVLFEEGFSGENILLKVDNLDYQLTDLYTEPSKGLAGSRKIILKKTKVNVEILINKQKIKYDFDLAEGRNLRINYLKKKITVKQTKGKAVYF